MATKKQIKYPYEFDPKKRKLAKVYTKVKIINSIINSIIIPIAFLILFVVFGGHVWLQGVVFSVTLEFLLQIPIYAFILSIFLVIVQFPLSFYSSFIYEHKYGLSNYKLTGWFKDFFKEELVYFIFFLPAITVLYYLIGLTPLWWLYAGIIFAVVATILDFIMPVILLPFFYKLEPYKDEIQKKKLLAMIRKAGVKNLNTVLVAKESEKSKKPNAMFTGFGKTKRMILFDTLLDSFTPDEIETVIGHELGHYVHRDSIKGLLIEIVLMFPILFVISLLLPPPTVSYIHIIATIPLFILYHSIIDLILMPFINTHSRRIEKQADIFALDVSRKPDAQISTEKRLADMALGDDSPHPLIETILFTHPMVKKRIKTCVEWKQKNKKV